MTKLVQRRIPGTRTWHISGTLLRLTFRLGPLRRSRAGTWVSASRPLQTARFACSNAARRAAVAAVVAAASRAGVSRWSQKSCPPAMSRSAASAIRMSAAAGWQMGRSHRWRTWTTRSPCSRCFNASPTACPTGAPSSCNSWAPFVTTHPSSWSWSTARAATFSTRSLMARRWPTLRRSATSRRSCKRCSTCTSATSPTETSRSKTSFFATTKSVCWWISRRPSRCVAWMARSSDTSRRRESASIVHRRCTSRGSRWCRSSAQATLRRAPSSRSPTTSAVARSSSRQTPCPADLVRPRRSAMPSRRPMSLHAACAPSCSLWESRRGQSRATPTPPSPSSGATAWPCSSSSGVSRRRHQAAPRRRGCFHRCSAPRLAAGPPWRSVLGARG
mmetsp:Transcript_5311/g.15793  ORF Transcript_5311/g.15793 Transcript_5311/m.15793 type:complete len:389 (+) Transcript_5311:664-1830(+)